MVGILLVSHSRALAHNLVELAREAAPAAYIVAVGGAGPDGQDFGSDATAIMGAIEAAKASTEPKLSGLLVLLDIGSSLLSAQMALELLGPDPSFPVKLCPGPLVEGALLAASQAIVEMELEALFVEVLHSLDAKYQQLGCELPGPATTAAEEPIQAALLEKVLIVKLANGLHARPAAKLVQLTQSHGVEAYIAKKAQAENRASAARALAIAKLNVRCGDELLVSVVSGGPESEAYLGKVAALLAEE